MADASALNVVLTANFKRLEQDLKKAGMIAQQSVADIEDKFAKANPKLNTSAMLGGFVGGAVSGVVAELVNQIAQIPQKIIEANREMANLAETARRVGLTTDQLQASQFVGRQNGLTGEQSTQAMKGFASAIAGANEEGSKLGQLLSDNGIKITNAAGKQRSMNDLLADAARLIQGAGNEQEKIDMAKLLGVSEDWIRILEKGPEAFRMGQAMAVATGNVISKELIDKAQAFDEVWSRSFGNFQTWAKTAAIEAASAFQKFLAVSNVVTDPTSLARRQQEMLAQAQQAGPDTLKGQYFTRRAGEVGDLLEQQLGPELERAKKALAIRMAQQAEEALLKANGTFKPGAYGDLVRPKATNTAALAKTGSGSTAEETDAVDRYINSLQKTVEVLAAEQAALGKSKEERALGIEMAKLEAAARLRGTAATDEEIAKTQELARRKGELNQALALYAQKQHQVADLAQFTGQQIQGAFESLLDGGKIEDSINRITRALASVAIQAALLGQGPLAGLMGAAAAPGGNGIGGLIGSLITPRASGGPVQAGRTYLVGENGREFVTFGQNGTVHPDSVNGARGGGGGGLQVVVNNNAGAQVGVQETRGPGGVRQLEIMVEAAVVKNIAKNGGIAQALQNTYGNNRVAGRR